MTLIERIQIRLTKIMRDEGETTGRRIKASEFLELLQTDPDAFLEVFNDTTT
jgi:hypothetical protein